LSFSFVEPDEAKLWVDEYYALIQSTECQPVGFAVNPNVAVVVPFMCHADEQTAIERGIDGAHFFGYSLAHYYVFGEHQPGVTNLWEEFQRNRDRRGFARHLVQATDAPLPVRLLQESLGSLRGAIGTPKQITNLLERYERAGVDEVIFVSQAGRNQHEHICESIELFAREVLPQFQERAEQHEAGKRARLAPAIERALLRRTPTGSAPAGYTIWPDHEAWQHVTHNGHLPGARRDLPKSALGWLLRGRGEGQLDRIFGTPAAQAIIFRGMERAFRAGPVDAVRGTLQYDLTSRTRTRRWVVRVGNGRLTASPGTAAHPDATLRMPVATFARIAAGHQTAGSAAMQGELQIDGDLALVGRVSALLGQPPL
jgi:hypothetical protein